MDQEKEVHNQLVRQVSSQKILIDTLTSQKNGFKTGLDTQKRVNDDLRKQNANLALKNDDLKSNLKIRTTILYVVTSIAILETMIILAK